MSNFNTNQFPNNGEQTAPKKKISKGWKIAAGAVAVFAVIGVFASTGDNDSDSTAATSTEAQPTSTTATVAEQTDNDAPAPTPTAEPVTDNDDDSDGGSWLDDLTSDESHTLRFEADTSDGSTGMVTYVGKDFNIIQAADEPMPWSAEQTDIASKFDVIGANMSVQQDGSGEVSCRMYWDDELVAESTSTGPYTIASCNADL